ncbi:MAG: DUF4926 domain-containing protein [Chloroflexi bacterium]|nr:DUF4926 domain-containing protein [Chloroflexota bacterium]MCC6893915.1 DUF4926 domain-containing protein [Anaerolineae bacterium]
MHPELYTRVALVRDVPEANLKRGDTAMYIDHAPIKDGETGAVLEVFNAVGESISVVTVPLSAIEVLRADHILTVRTRAS